MQPSADQRAFEYRPHLDGLRTIAVYLVVAFHGGADRLSGGFIGVDLFFVLSGYLVTQVVLGDLRLTRSIRLARFYSRRVRRLLPAAVMTLVVTAILFSLVASPAEARSSVDSFRAALLYFANWHFIGASTNYFAGELNGDPVLHFWSLSIEEQFYLVWPLALMGLMALRRRLARGDAVVRLLVAGLLLASAAWAVHLAGHDVNRAYYGTDTRAYQLLAGALLALSPEVATVGLGRTGRRIAAAGGVASVLGVLLLGTSVVDVGPITRGLLATGAAVSALAFLERSRDSSPARRALSVEPMTYLGRISYGTYLWHWPVIILLTRIEPMSPIVLVPVAAVLATGLASLSSQLLELPIRRSNRLGRMPRTVAVSGLSLSVLFGLLVVPSILERDSGSQRAVVASGGVAEVNAGPTASVDWQSAAEDHAAALTCTPADMEACLAVDGRGATIMLLGDSHGVMLRPTLEEIARRRGYRLFVPAAYGCSWHIGLAKSGQSRDEQEACFETQHDWYDRMIPAVHPDLVVVIQRALDDPDRSIQMVGDATTPPGLTQAELYRATAERTLKTLQEAGQPVAIVESIPVVSPERDPLKCLSRSAQVDACRYVASEGSTPLEDYYRSQADGRRVFLVNIDAIVCPYFPICDPIVDGMVVKWDDTHLTTTYARAISEQVEQVLDDVGALP